MFVCSDSSNFDLFSTIALESQKKMLFRNEFTQSQYTSTTYTFNIDCMASSSPYECYCQNSVQIIRGIIRLEKQRRCVVAFDSIVCVYRFIAMRVEIVLNQLDKLGWQFSLYASQQTITSATKVDFAGLLPQMDDEQT